MADFMYSLLLITASQQKKMKHCPREHCVTGHMKTLKQEGTSDEMKLFGGFPSLSQNDFVLNFKLHFVITEEGTL